MLEPAGHEVIEASEGIAAIKAYFSNKPDIVFLDLTMEGMTGMDVLKKLLRMDREAKIVIASADIQTGTRQEAMEEGAAGYLNKPYTIGQVTGAIDNLLKGGQA